MKKIILTLTAFAILAGTSSCKKFVDGYEVSPNASSEATPALLLSASELAVFATYGGAMNRNASMWTQQSAGCQFQSQQIDQYALDEGDIQNEWQVVYNGMKNARVLKEKAGVANPHYQGISNVITALLLGATTDFWGDVPYRDAFKGQELQYTAEYDPQQQIIADIQAMLTDAIAMFNQTSNVLTPGSDDFIYGGDVQKWKGLAYALKARYATRISKRDANWFTKALEYSDSAIASGFNSSASDANCIFGSNSNEYNQWYAFTRVERAGYIYADSGFVTMLQSNSDPRLPFYFTQNDSGNYAGSPLGKYVSENVSAMGDYFASQSSVTPICTFVELMFIRAEASFAAGLKSDAAKAYNDAVLAHVEQVTGAPASGGFVMSTASENAGSITQQKIMTQKYISDYAMLEVFSDWRRTNIPALSANPDASIGGIARRFPSSLEERLYNSKSAGHLAGINDLFSMRVWWDN